MNYEDYKAKFTAWAALTEQRLGELCDEFLPPHEEIAKAARYSLLGGGKRIRAVLALAACELSGTAPEKALDYACALEMLHCYSLIHDDMPKLDAFLHYRNIDVSSLKELVRRWYPRVYFQLPKKIGSHRALADIRESIQELAYYRQAVLVAEPGPDSEKAKQIAKKVADTI